MGLTELAVIAVVAVLVFGPDKVPEMARQAGQLLRQVRTLATNARDDLRSELGDEYADLQLTDLDPRTIVRKHVIEAMESEDDDRAPGSSDRRRVLAQGEVPPYDTEAT